MKFKKFAMALTVSILALSMAGCSGSNNTTNDDNSTSAKLTGTEGKLVWATNAEFPPYEYREGGEIVGIDAEIVQYIGEQLGLEPQVEDMNFDSIVPAVQGGKADIGVAGMTINEDRLANVNFSDTYVNAGQVIIVKKDSTITGAADLEGKVIGVQLGTVGDTYSSENVNAKDVQRYSKGFEAVQALSQGKIDAVVIDGEPAKAFAEANDDIKILDEQLTQEEYAIAVNKNNQALLDAINGVIADMKENGKLAEITNKYLNDSNSEETENQTQDANDLEEETAIAE